MNLESPAAAGSVTKPQQGKIASPQETRPSHSQSATTTYEAPARVVMEDRLYQVVARNRMVGGLVLANLIGLLIAGAFISRILRRITRVVSAPGAAFRPIAAW